MKTPYAKSLYRVIQSMRQEPVFEKLKWLESTQWMSPDELRELQLRKLRTILTHCVQNIPYYRETFQSKLSTIRNLDSPEQLEDLPFLTKQQVHENFFLLQSPNYRGRKAIESTSGSTGDPMRFVLDRDGSAFVRALSYREHRWYNLDIGAKEVRFYGIPMDTLSYYKERFKDILMNRKRFSVFNLSPDNLKRYYQTAKEYEPEYIYGYTSAVFEFVNYLHKNNLQFDKPFLKAVILTSEVLLDNQRSLIEKFLDVPVINEYGTSEFGIIAAECPHHNLHLSSENIFVEIAKNGRKVEEGESGEVVITGLSNFAMPLIRYEVGDVASLSNEKCPCGRGLPVLNNIDGRVNNMVMTPEGEVSSGLVFYYISRSLIENNGGIKKFKVVQNALDEITFHIVKDDNFKQKNINALETKTHEYLSPRIKVNFEFHSELSHTTNGKIIHFISEISNSN